MYVGRKGMGAEVSVPISDWGFISPCSIAAASSNSGSGDGSSSAVTWGILAAVGVLLFATFKGGN